MVREFQHKRLIQPTYVLSYRKYMRKNSNEETEKMQVEKKKKNHLKISTSAQTIRFILSYRTNNSTYDSSVHKTQAKYRQAKFPLLHYQHNGATIWMIDITHWMGFYSNSFKNCYRIRLSKW